jgi:hypothetical protein
MFHKLDAANAIMFISSMMRHYRLKNLNASKAIENTTFTVSTKNNRFCPDRFCPLIVFFGPDMLCLRYVAR